MSGVVNHILTPYFLDKRLPGLDHLAGSDWVVNQPELPVGGQLSRMAVLYQALAENVWRILEKGHLPVSIAGDCCTALGVWAGLQRADVSPQLIWFDAHGDFNTWETTPSGFLGGMPLAMLVGRGEQYLLKAVNVHPLEEDRVVLTDARDLDPGEREAVEDARVTHLKDPRMVLDGDFVSGDLWVHFDTDILDPEECPAMNYPARGGPSPENLRAVFRGLAAKGTIRAASLSSWAPALDESGRSEALCLSLLGELLGG